MKTIHTLFLLFICSFFNTNTFSSEWSKSEKKYWDYLFDEDSEKFEKEIADLSAQKNYKKLVQIFENCYWIVANNAYIELKKARSEEIDKLLRPLAVKDSIEYAAFEANMYFAEIGDTTALSNLHYNWGAYGGPSEMWAGAVSLFGKWKYEPAIENLLSHVGAANLTLQESALKALMSILEIQTKEIDELETWEEVRALIIERAKSNK